MRTVKKDKIRTRNN